MLYENININRTIQFDVQEWRCTDPDNGQFCHIINSHTFEYIQIKDTNKLEHKAKHALEHLNDKTTISDWYYDYIDTNDYTESEKREYTEPYGSESFLNPYGNNDKTTINQLTAECIFEQEILIENLETIPF